MRIPSGDLAPVRKRRRYGKRRNPLPVLLGVLLVAVIASGAYVLHREDSSAGQVTQAARCPSPMPVKTAAPAPVVAPVVLPPATKVAFRLLNGTGRNGLAKTVGNELARRGFRVAGMGNAPKPLAGPTRIVFGPGGRPAATLVAAHVSGAVLVPAPRAPRGSVDVTLGSSFSRLRNGSEVGAYVRDLGKPAPPPTPTPAARGCA